MKIGIPKEIVPDESRVALVPACVGKLVKAGLEIVVETGAGAGSGAADGEYESKGASIERDTRKLFSEVDAVAKVRAPIENTSLGAHEVELMKEGAMLFANLGALGGLEDRSLADRLTGRKIAAYSMDCVPRITRAQSMDVLSSMSTISGYKAVLIAADNLPKLMPMMMTAAGTLAAAKVFILGAGVAGLQAIATAKRLGAIVEAFDTRSAVKEQVQSLGARFVAMDLGHGDAEGAGGYAKELSEEHHKKEQQLLADHVKKSDIVITTALIPGRKAPILVTEDMVKSMQPGSVIVDLAAERGGNCECTVPGEQVVKHGVTICGRLNLPGTVPIHASQMLSRNMSTLLLHLCKDGTVTLDAEDEIVAGALITQNGQITHEPTKNRMTKEGVS